MNRILFYIFVGNRVEQARVLNYQGLEKTAKLEQKTLGKKAVMEEKYLFVFLL
jgi:hypothetical protein